MDPGLTRLSFLASDGAKMFGCLYFQLGTTYIRGLLPTIGDVNSRRSPFKKVRRMRKTINRILSMKGLHSNFGSRFAGGGGGRVQCPQEAPWAEQRGACLQDGFWGGCRNVSPSSQGAECWSCRGNLSRGGGLRWEKAGAVASQNNSQPGQGLTCLLSFSQQTLTEMSVMRQGLG